MAGYRFPFGERQDLTTMKWPENIYPGISGEIRNAREQKAQTAATAAALGRILALGIVRLRQKHATPSSRQPKASDQADSLGNASQENRDHIAPQNSKNVELGS